MNVDERLLRLEKENHRLKRLVGVGFLGFALVFILGAALMDLSGENLRVMKNAVIKGNTTLEGELKVSKKSTFKESVTLLTNGDKALVTLRNDADAGVIELKAGDHTFFTLNQDLMEWKSRAGHSLKVDSNGVTFVHGGETVTLVGNKLTMGSFAHIDKKGFFFRSAAGHESKWP